MNRVLCFVVLVCAVQCSPMSQGELEDFSNFLLKTSQLDLQVKKGADPDYDLDENEIVSDHAWEESGKFEGDLILNDRQRRLIVENVEGLSRNGLTDSTKRWPNNEVIYFIQREHFNGGQVQAIQSGIDDLAQASCIKFRPYRKGDRDAVVIQGSRPGCFSQVGYQGGYQVLNLSGRHPVGRGCFRHGTVVHEMLHTLGFYHMQSSPDRDDYINVMWANIVQPARHNFRKYNSFSVSDFGVGYDYDSVLHYSRKAFSANGQDTLVPKQRGAEIGQRVGLSDKDTQKLNKMYCDADNDQVQADENGAQKPKNKKKKPKNPPFQGHGIGYHQGKTLVIKLPAAQTYKLPHVPSTSVFDFSKTPQVVSTPEAEGYRFGKEVTYSFSPTILGNSQTPPSNKNEDSFELKPSVHKDIHKHHQTRHRTPDSVKDVGSNNLSSAQHSDHNEVKPEYVPIDDYDKDLKESFDRLTKIVKQHVYPRSQDYSPKVNKDYSKFYSPISNTSHSLSEKLEDLISYGPTNPPSTSSSDKKSIEKPMKDRQANDKMGTEDEMNSSYRTSLPIKKPYSSFTKTETPQYATLEYLKDRHDFSNIYSPVRSEEDKRKGLHHIDESSSDPKLPETDYYIGKPMSDKKFHTDYVKDSTVGFLKDSPKKEKDDQTNNEKLTQNKEIDDRMDSSYRTLFSAPKRPYSAYLPTETPKYATLEYLKDRHNFSMLYSDTSDNEKRKEPYMILTTKTPFTESDWYKNDNNDKHNAANYDEGFYSDYVKQDHGHLKGANNDHLTDTNDHADENSTGSKKTQDKYYDHGFQTDLDKYENRGRPIHDSYEHSDEKEPTENLTKYVDNDDHGYYTDFPHEDSKFSKEAPKKSEQYTLYGDPVPVTNDWFKPSYLIPNISSDDDHSWSQEDKNR